MPFVKGQSGNPGGRRKGSISLEVQALLRQLTPEAVNTLAEIMRDKSLAASARATAALGILKKVLPDLASVEHSGEVETSYAIRSPLPDATSDEWQKKHNGQTLQ